jgi:hypothetical protein
MLQKVRSYTLESQIHRTANVLQVNANGHPCVAAEELYNSNHPGFVVFPGLRGFIYGIQAVQVYKVAYQRALLTLCAMQQRQRQSIQHCSAVGDHSYLAWRAYGKV